MHFGKNGQTLQYIYFISRKIIITRGYIVFKKVKQNLKGLTDGSEHYRV